MYNPFTFIKDVIDLLRDPPGEAVAAMEITSRNMNHVIGELGPRSESYAKIGDFMLYFENSATIVPRDEFFKHYEFVGTPQPDVMHRVKTIKPL